MDHASIQRKGHLIRAMLRECFEHERTFNDRCPTKILKLRYDSALEPFGGFDEVMEELMMDGSVIVHYNRWCGNSVCLRRPAHGLRFSLMEDAALHGFASRQFHPKQIQEKFGIELTTEEIKIYGFLNW